MIKLYAKSVEKVGSQDRDRVKGYTEGVSRYDGSTSKHSFSPINHDGFNVSDLAIASSIKEDPFAEKRVD